MNHAHTRIGALLLAALTLAGCGTAPAVEVAGEVESAVRPQDDFYLAVNGQWLEGAEIGADKVSVGGFQDLQEEVRDLLMADFAAMDGADGPLGQFLAYYAMAADYDTRDAQGTAPLEPHIDRIQALESLGDLDAGLDEWLLDGLPAPLTLYAAPDMLDAGHYALYAAGPDLFLPEVGYYADPAGAELLGLLEETGTALLATAGVEEPELVMADALAFDALLVPYAKTAEESSDYTALYNPVSLDAFAAWGGALDLGGLVRCLTGEGTEQVIVTNPDYFAAMAEVVTEETFPLLKSWMLFQTVYGLAAYLDRDTLETAGGYGMALTGQLEPDDPDELAFALASGMFSEVVGDYYGRTYFGEAARADVTEMAQALIAVYKSRLEGNDWLSPETAGAAVAKLDAMEIHIGYPDAIDPLYDQFTVTGPEEGGTLLGNAMAFSRLAWADNFSKCGGEVDRSAWTMTAHTVNAQYSPTANTITVPAAILQPPFYDPDGDPSANYGGIGAIIAHEITHAFDSSGAKFDGDGNLVNWWTEADYAAFEARTRAMVDLFDGRSWAGGQVNGQLTVTENTADAGGLSCALEVVEALPDGDLEAFFTGWAAIWRMKATEEYAQLLLALDVHAPGHLRANVQLGNLDAFYTVFSVTEEDGMYIPPEERVSIW